jgi:hypothetical protein
MARGKSPSVLAWIWSSRSIIVLSVVMPPWVSASCCNSTLPDERNDHLRVVVASERRVEVVPGFAARAPSGTASTLEVKILTTPMDVTLVFSSMLDRKPSRSRPGSSCDTYSAASHRSRRLALAQSPASANDDQRSRNPTASLTGLGSKQVANGFERQTEPIQSDRACFTKVSDLLGRNVKSPIAL